MKGSTRKYVDKKMSLMFKEICINEEMLPNIYIYIYSLQGNMIFKTKARAETVFLSNSNNSI